MKTLPLLLGLYIKPLNDMDYQPRYHKCYPPTLVELIKWAFIYLPVIILIAWPLGGCQENPKESLPIAAVDKKGGYKNLRLNAPLDSIQKLVKLTPTLDNKCTNIKKYVVDSDAYNEIGIVRCKAVELEFIRDTLDQITLYIPYRSESFEQLITIYSGEFGEPSKIKKDDGFDSYSWDGNHARIYLLGGTIMPDMQVSYSSGNWQRSYEEEEKCKERQLKKGRADL